MAIQVGTNPFIGQLGSTVGTRYGNKFVMRRNNPVTAYRIKHEDCFKRTRENGTGFGGAGRMAKALLQAWNICKFNATDGTVFSRLNGAIYHVQRKGPGIRGNQTIQPSKFGHELLSFDLAKDRKVATAITGTPNWDYDPTSGRIRLWMPQNAKIHRTMAPAVATHATLRLMVTIISDYEYQPAPEADKKGIFLPITHDNHGCNGTVETPPIPLTATGADINGVLLEMNLPYEIQPHQSLVITWGVAYWNYNAEGSAMINRNHGLRRKELHEGAMQILTIHPTDKARHYKDPDPLAYQPEPEKPQLIVWNPDLPEYTITKTDTINGQTIKVQQIRLQTIHEEIP